MKYLRILLACLSLGLILSCGRSSETNSPAASNTTSQAERPSATEATPDIMAAGRSIYSDKCADCHKESGKGGKMEIEGRKIEPEDLTSNELKKMPDEKLYKYIYAGSEDDGMPAFKNKLSEAEIREVVRYIRSELQGVPVAVPTKGPGVD